MKIPHGKGGVKKKVISCSSVSEKQDAFQTFATSYQTFMTSLVRWYSPCGVLSDLNNLTHTLKHYKDDINKDIIRDVSSSYEESNEIN